jgi:hypothetical protein
VPFTPKPLPKPADKVGYIPDPCIDYVERPPDPPLGYLEAALRRMAAATYAEADVIERVRADNDRLEDENRSLRWRVAELEGRRYGQLRRIGAPFGTPVPPAVEQAVAQ